MRFREVFQHLFTVQLAIAVGVIVLITAVLLVAIVRSRAHRRTGLPFAATENRIDVSAYRWCWDFAYADTSVRVTGTCANAATRRCWWCRPDSP